MADPGRLWADERGASAAEYAILLAVLGGALVLSALALGQSIVCSLDDSATIVAGGDPQDGHQYGNSAPPGKAKGHHPGC